MKAVITLLLILFMSVLGFAKNLPLEEKVTTLEKGVVLEQTTLISFKNLEITNEKQLTRLYMYKNSRILKELAFRTKRNRIRQA
ncbi:hypothetical protein [uncultured Maribacter sp.]|uniref:hypothetical protein n=1 Tax=uncultured Maribacter sp. TaxID=431308 RepID=UPI002624DCD8|nr:hypothetical protein [uncultured Maribacter sp.]